MLRRLYDWCLGAAGKPYALWLLGGVAFAESSFFPVPPDVMLIPMCLAQPHKAWRYATLCVVASVLGGLVGYYIGAALYDTIGAWIIRLYGLAGKMEGVREKYNQYGAAIILLKGLTPIPYKVVTITSGFFRYNLALFVVFSILARATRFYPEAFLLNRYGEQARHMIEKRLGLWVGLGATIVLVGLVGAVYLF